MNPSSGPAAHRSWFHIGGVSVQVASERRTDVMFGSSLDPFRIDVGGSDIEIRVRWVEEVPRAQGRKVFDSGSVWRLYECDDGFQFDFSTPNLGGQPYKRFTVDRCFRAAALQMNEKSFAGRAGAAEPMDYPLDELLIMHRLTQEKAIELHGSGIVRADGVGNLFVGHSGAGKSTTTRLWTERDDVEVLSDDRIIVRRDGDASAIETPGVAAGSASQHGGLRLRDRSASPAGHSAQHDKKHKMRMYGTPWHGEAMYASPNSAPLARIFVLEHGHGNLITPLTTSQAVAELFARSFVPFHRHEYVDSALVFLEELANAVPVYRYAFEPDQRAVEKIRNFHD